MNKPRNRFPEVTAMICIGLLALSFASFVEAAANDKKLLKKIKIRVDSDITHGMAPLTMKLVAQIDAPEELNKILYESTYEWIIEGSFVLTSIYTGGNPEDPSLRNNPISGYERSLRSTKHLVGKSRIRRPRKKYEEGMEVQRTYELEFEFNKAGVYYVYFWIKKHKIRSNQFKIIVKGDTTYDPLRPRP